MITSSRIPFALLFALASTAHAGPRVSEDLDYTVATDTLDAGGNRSTHAGADYTNDGSLGGISGVSTVALPAETVKAGYIGQLYEVIGLRISAPGIEVDETSTHQFTAAQALDDDTSLNLAATDVAWTVVSGPLAGIDANGLATAGTVYQDTAAIIQGVHQGMAVPFPLTVIDSVPDNFGSYAGDGLGDDWQFQYFGLGDPDAMPGIDADGDGHDNDFEFVAGLIPTDPTSRFLLRIEPVPDEAGKKNLIFSPIVAGRTYTVEHSDSLAAGSWAPLTGSTQGDDDGVRTVTDHDATEPKNFYRVDIQNP